VDAAPGGVRDDDDAGDAGEQAGGLRAVDARVRVEFAREARGEDGCETDDDGGDGAGDVALAEVEGAVVDGEDEDADDADCEPLAAATGPPAVGRVGGVREYDGAGDGVPERGERERRDAVQADFDGDERGAPDGRQQDEQQGGGRGAQRGSVEAHENSKQAPLL